MSIVGHRCGATRHARSRAADKPMQKGHVARMDDRITIYGSFTSSSSYKPMLFLALAQLPYSFRTVNHKTGAPHLPQHLAINRYGQVPVLRHRGLTIVQSNVILDYLARVTGAFEPTSEAQRWQAREWLSWEADAITNVARVRHFSRFRE